MQVWRRRFQSCFASAVFVSRAAVHYWIHQNVAEASCVRAVAQLRSNLPPAIIQIVWGALASLAAASAMCYVGGVCVACCRALFDKPEPGAGFVRLCCRGVAFQPAVRSHTKDICGARNIGGVGSNCVLRRRFLRRFLRCADARLRGCVRAFYGAWRNQNTTATGKPTRHSATRQRHPKVCHTW